MNGSQQPADPGMADAPSAASNGSSGVTKKRKKDALKPIITTEGTTSPGYVESISWYIIPFYTERFCESYVRHAPSQVPDASV